MSPILIKLYPEKKFFDEVGGKKNATPSDKEKKMSKKNQ